MERAVTDDRPKTLDEACAEFHDALVGLVWEFARGLRLPQLADWLERKLKRS